MWIPEFLGKLFLAVLRMSLRGSVVILFVLVLRLLFRKAPRLCSYLLWAAVLLRLLCPFSMTGDFSVFRLFRIGEARDMIHTSQSGAQRLDRLLSGIETYTDGREDRTGPEAGDLEKMERTDAFAAPAAENRSRSVFYAVARTAAWVWLAGILVMTAHGLIGLVRLKRKLTGSIRLRDNIFLSDHIASPFVLGLFAPGIYLPSALGEEEQKYILLHEQIHIRRKDPLIKMAAYAALVIHWFNPLVWLSFFLVEKDMEMSCDEAVLRMLGEGIRADYSGSLLRLSAGRGMVAGTPLAFGENNVAARIRNVIRYRRPAARVVLPAAVLALTLTACLMTDPAVGPADEKQEAQEKQETDETAKRLEKSAQELALLKDEEVKQIAALEEAFKEEVRLQEASGEIGKWAAATCARDGRTVLSMCSEELRAFYEKEGMTDEGGVSFGWSSPWPWDEKKDYRIMEITQNRARILYYAWTSDPHVTVWEQSLSWHWEDAGLVMDAAKLEVLDSICTAEEFYRAYPEGIIDNTPVDYTANGAGEALNQNAVNQRKDGYVSPLFEPETAAGALLNLLTDENKVQITAQREAGRAQVVIYFPEDDSRVSVTMVQPYGEDGVWMATTFAET